MRREIPLGRWQQVPGKKRAHWGILTQDSLPKNNGKYDRLVAKLEARYQAGIELGEDKPKKKSDDFSI